MLRPRWYKVIHDLFGNKTRTLLIVLSMAVGLFAIGIILSARTILSDGLASSFAAIHPSSGTVRTVELFDENFIHSVRSMEEVQEADARLNIAARVEVAQLVARFHRAPRPAGIAGKRGDAPRLVPPHGSPRAQIKTSPRARRQPRTWPGHWCRRRDLNPYTLAGTRF